MKSYNAKYLKKTKIVATLGPSTEGKEMLYQLMEKGVDVFRINFSHADYDNVVRNIQWIHELNEEHGFNTAILGDLQGPKLRIGVMEEGRVVETGTHADVYKHNGTYTKIFDSMARSLNMDKISKTINGFS